MNAPITSRLGPNGGGRRREQLSDEVAAQLRAEIMSGALRPGTYIRLDETAARLGVSITPIREALRTLRGEGMVQLEPHRGHVVAPLTRGDIEDIFWLQATIARKLTAAAVDRITDAELDELTALNEALAAAVDRGVVGEVAAAMSAFHRVLHRTTGRIKLAWFLYHVARYMPPQIYATDQQWGTATVARHRELIAALRRRDTATATRVTVDLFTDSAQRLIAQLEKVGIWT